MEEEDDEEEEKKKKKRKDEGTMETVKRMRSSERKTKRNSRPTGASR